jgi:hypothetical protein
LLAQEIAVVIGSKAPLIHQAHRGLDPPTGVGLLPNADASRSSCGFRDSPAPHRGDNENLDAFLRELIIGAEVSIIAERLEDELIALEQDPVTRIAVALNSGAKLVAGSLRGQHKQRIVAQSQPRHVGRVGHGNCNSSLSVLVDEVVSVD